MKPKLELAETDQAIFLIMCLCWPRTASFCRAYIQKEKVKSIGGGGGAEIERRVQIFPLSKHLFVAHAISRSSLRLLLPEVSAGRMVTSANLEKEAT
jgi:hypothetical protein